MIGLRLIDRYVFFLFARVFVLCLLCMTGIYIVGDFVNNLTEFIELSGKNGGMFNVMVSYYGVRIPWFFDLCGRIVALIAAVFAITWLQRHNEMTALMAAGISRWRVLKPLLFGFALISILGALNRELILPKFQKQLSQKIQDILSKEALPVIPRVDRISNILISGDGAFAANKSIDKPRFKLPMECAKFHRQVLGEKAHHVSATDNHPNGYIVSGVFTPDKLDKRSSVYVDDQPLILTPLENDWLESDQCFVASNVSFAQLTNGRAWVQFSSTRSLIRAMQNPSLDLGQVVPVTIHARFVQPILDVTLFFLGVPIVLSRESRNVFVAIGSCLIIAVVFYVVILIAQSLGISFILSPAFAAWLPLMVLIPWAAFKSDPLWS